MILNFDSKFDLLRKSIFIIITAYSALKINSINYNCKEKYDILPRTNLKENTSNINLTDIFESRLLYIDDRNLTKEYIRSIRPLNETRVKYHKYKKSEKVYYSFKNRKDKLNYKEFIKICQSERLIYRNVTQSSKSPLISVILPSFNKEKVINEINKKHSKSIFEKYRNNYC